MKGRRLPALRYWPREYIILIVSVGVFLLLGTSLPDVLFRFYVAGSIPGTRTAIPWLLMLLIYLEIGFFTVRYARSHGLYPGSPRIKKAQTAMVARQLRNQKRREAYALKKAAERRLAPKASQISRAVKRSRPTVAAPPKGTASSRHPQTA